MAVEVTDIESQPAPASTQEEPSVEQETAPPAVALQRESSVAAPRGRGWPAGSKDKQPRKRPARAASADAMKSEEEEPQRRVVRPVTRRSRPPSSAPKRRVQIVEEESDSPEEAPPSPRTRRHQEWTAYRQHKTSAHQANVNRYAALFDRMLA